MFLVFFCGPCCGPLVLLLLACGADLFFLPELFWVFSYYLIPGTFFAFVLVVVVVLMLSVVGAAWWRDFWFLICFFAYFFLRFCIFCILFANVLHFFAHFFAKFCNYLRLFADYLHLFAFFSASNSCRSGTAVAAAAVEPSSIISTY